jgi:peptidoglycan/xylan/chitin deacetylase (PgdA/CDA1 family)
MRDVEARAAIRFEPHSLTHPRLPLASDAYAREEIAGSKAAVEGELVAARVFSYPGGYFRERDVALTREAGHAGRSHVRVRGQSQLDEPLHALSHAG